MEGKLAAITPGDKSDFVDLGLEEGPLSAYEGKMDFLALGGSCLRQHLEVWQGRARELFEKAVSKFEARLEPLWKDVSFLLAAVPWDHKQFSSKMKLHRKHVTARAAVLACFGCSWLRLTP